MGTISGIIFVLISAFPLLSHSQISVRGAGDYTCSVECPEGFLGGCVKSHAGWACSCQKDAKSLAASLTRALERAGASEDVARKATLSIVEGDFKPTTVIDPKTGYEYQVILIKPDGAQ